VCATATSTCVGCTADSQCPGPAPYCTPESQTCAAPCGNAQTRCAGACVDLASDRENCGTCGAEIPDGGACDAGVATCPSGSTNCGTTCATLESDTANCGKCGNACSPNPRGYSVCASSTCGFEVEWGGSPINQTTSCAALCAPAACLSVASYAYGNSDPGAACPWIAGTAPLSCEDQIPAAMSDPAPGCTYGAGLTDVICDCAD